MGPRSFNRGNAAGRRQVALADCPLQWGRGLSTAEIPRPSRRQVRRASSFNGAAVFQPRKSKRRAIGQSRPGGASMGPRSFNRGNLSLHPSHNGCRNRLQWGRGLSTAEIRCAGWRCDGSSGASMGPRSFNRGNGNVPRERAFSILRLGWGRGLSTAEMEMAAVAFCWCSPKGMGPRSFNRGNGNEADAKG